MAWPVAAAAAPVVTVGLLPGSQRKLPRMGFGTELVWEKASDAALGAAAAAAGNRVVRYPGGTVLAHDARADIDGFVVNPVSGDVEAVLVTPSHTELLPVGENGERFKAALERQACIYALAIYAGASGMSVTKHGFLLSMASGTSSKHTENPKAVRDRREATWPAGTSALGGFGVAPIHTYTHPKTNTRRPKHPTERESTHTPRQPCHRCASTFQR